MKLYFAPGACSLSPHIVLEEAGIAAETEQVNNQEKKTKSGKDYWTINPKGQVPALQLDSGEMLTEGPVIVQYLADQKPASGLVPPAGSIERDGAGWSVRTPGGSVAAQAVVIACDGLIPRIAPWLGGVIYPVNPKRKAVHGVYCYPSLMEVPEVVDLAVLATPASSVPATIQQCVARGIPAVTLTTAGERPPAAFTDRAPALDTVRLTGLGRATQELIGSLDRGLELAQGTTSFVWIGDLIVPGWAIELLRNRTDPSTIAKFAPPGCRLPKALTRGYS